MKLKIRIISTILLLAMLLTACASTTIETQMQPTSTEEVTLTPTIEQTPMPTRIEDIGRILYPFRQSYDFRDSIELENDPICINELLQPHGVVEDDVPKDITWEFDGIEFELVYWYSSMFIFNSTVSDVYCDFYAVKKYGKTPPAIVDFVAFKHGTNQVISFAVFPGFGPWSESNLNTLEDYVSVIKETSGESVDLSNYELTCTTEFTDKHGEKRIINEYYEVAEDESIIEYSFSYTLKNGENETGNRISFTHTKGPLNAYVFINEISDYLYDEVINVTDEEMEESRKLIDEYTKNNKEQYIKILSDFEFVRFDALYGREYLVFNFMYYTDVYADYLVEDNQYIYIDYERLQWKMALEGK